VSPAPKARLQAGHAADIRSDIQVPGWALSMRQRDVSAVCRSGEEVGKRRSSSSDDPRVEQGSKGRRIVRK
jgi:hypothetical protein